MAQKDLDNLFDKFFASKEKSKKLKRSKPKELIGNNENEANRVVHPIIKKKTNSPTADNVKTITQRKPLIVPPIFKTQPKGHHIIENDQDNNQQDENKEVKTRSGRVTKKPDRFQ
jgi:DNA replication protein DnaD